MQLIGIGIWELLLIMILTMVVVGPERLPEVAAQLARWIRQAQAYASYVRKDFTEVISELERETGTSREDLREIAAVLRRDTTSVLEEIDKAGKEVERAANVEEAAGASVIPLSGGAAANGAQSNGAVDSTAVKEAAMAAEGEAAAGAEPSEGGQAAPAAKEEDWFVPSRGRRRRNAGDEAR